MSSITLLGGCFKPTWVGFISIRLYFERLNPQSLSQKDIISSKLLISNFMMAMFVGGRVRFFIRSSDSTVSFCDVLGMSRYDRKRPSTKSPRLCSRFCLVKILKVKQKAWAVDGAFPTYCFILRLAIFGEWLAIFAPGYTHVSGCVL